MCERWPVNFFREKKNVVNRLRIQSLELDLWGWSPGFAAFQSRDLRQVTLHCVSAAPPGKHRS